MVYVGRFGDAELTDEERATVQGAFAALVRAGRPLFGPAPEEGALIDPADPGLNTRVAAILGGRRPSLVLDEHGSMGRIEGFGPAPLPLPLRREEVDDGDELALLDELDHLDPELDIAEIDALMVPDDGAADDAGDAGGRRA